MFAFQSFNVSRLQVKVPVSGIKIGIKMRVLVPNRESKHVMEAEEGKYVELTRKQLPEEVRPKRVRQTVEEPEGGDQDGHLDAKELKVLARHILK